MFEVKGSKSMITRLVIYLIALVLIFAGYWFSGNTRAVYSEVNPDGSFTRNQLVREASRNAPPLPDFIFVDHRLYLLTESGSASLFVVTAKKRSRAWTANDLHAFRNAHPEFKSLLNALPPKVEIIPLQLQ